MNSSREGTSITDQLSPREMSVFMSLCTGKRISHIAKELNLSVKTISTYHHRIREKTGLMSHIEMFKHAVIHGLIEDQDLKEVVITDPQSIRVLPAMTTVQVAGVVVTLLQSVAMRVRDQDYEVLKRSISFKSLPYDKLLQRRAKISGEEAIPTPPKT